MEDWEITEAHHERVQCVVRHQGSKGNRRDSHEQYSVQPYHKPMLDQSWREGGREGVEEGVEGGREGVDEGKRGKESSKVSKCPSNCLPTPAGVLGLANEDCKGTRYRLKAATLQNNT